MLRFTRPRPGDRKRHLLLLLAWVLLVPAYSQTQETTATESDSAPSTETTGEPSETPPEAEGTAPEDQPETIPLEEVAVRAQAILETLLTAGVDVKRPAILEAIQEGMPGVDSDLDSIAQELDSIADSGRVGRRLVRIDDELNATGRQLDGGC